ncbi:MAG TPA: universal stress protein [Methylomirabilota bacterium]|nr:universal stress protein [Methylomirabilota bacterium]
MDGTGYHRIVVAVDFSPASEEAWAHARRLAALSDAEIVLTHVVPEAPRLVGGPLTRARLAEVRAALRRWADDKLTKWAETARAEGRRVRLAVRIGIPYEEIVDLTTDERADLVVIGTRGRSGGPRALLGSVAERVVRLAPCPVLSVHARP